VLSALDRSVAADGVITAPSLAEVVSVAGWLCDEDVLTTPATDVALSADVNTAVTESVLAAPSKAVESSTPASVFAVLAERVDASVAEVVC
jgi:hypothetical protein